MSEEIKEKTEKLLKTLNYFIAHIVVYFIVNIAMITYAFSGLSERWWVFPISVIWSFALIYHSILVYGIDLLKTRNKKLKLLFSYLAKLSIG